MRKRKILPIWDWKLRNDRRRTTRTRRRKQTYKTARASSRSKMVFTNLIILCLWSAHIFSKHNMCDTFLMYALLDKQFRSLQPDRLHGYLVDCQWWCSGNQPKIWWNHPGRFSGWFLAKSALHKTVILLEIRRGGFPAGFHRSIIDGPHGMFVETVV